jgi:similar to spore coat protein
MIKGHGKQMLNDYLELENAEGMPDMVNATIALEFLMSAKTGVRNCAAALTEVADMEARKVLRDLLDSSVNLHGELTQLMLRKGGLRSYHVNEQFQLDVKSAQMALKIAGLNLFPGNTDRLGTFATPTY